MKYLTIFISVSLDKIGVTEIGRYSWQLWDSTTLGTGVMELVFYWEGTVEKLLNL